MVSKKMLVVYAVLVLLSACSGGGDNGVDDAETGKTAGFYYEKQDTSAAVTIPLVPLRPAIQGELTSFSVSPPLPNGININPTNGEINGTPTTATPSTNYTVTAEGASGVVSATISLEVDSTLSPPTGLNYLCDVCDFAVGQTSIPTAPTSTGGQATSYSVSPSLPAGLNFDSVTGIISGSPIEATDATNYVVTATNATGSATTDIIIETPATLSPPVGIEYATGNLSVLVGVPMDPFAPDVVIGQITQCSASSLPDGLNIDPQTGTISGTPKTTVTNKAVEISCGNSAGAVEWELNLSVVTVPTAPTGFTYESTAQTFVVGQAIHGLEPHFDSNGQNCKYSASGLPAGLTINEYDGDITGTPTTVTSETQSTINATCDGGSANVAIATSVQLTDNLPPNPSSIIPTVSVGQTLFTQITNVSDGSFSSYAAAKSYCESTVSAALGGKWELPGDLHTFFLGLEIQSDFSSNNPQKFGNWILAPVWVEANGGDESSTIAKKNIRSFDLAGAKSGTIGAVDVGIARINLSTGQILSFTGNGAPVPIQVVCFKRS